MSAVLRDDRISVKEYLEGELLSEIKHEYIDGYVYAMAGASKNHQSITDNVLGEIRQHLKGSPCRPYGSDVKIKAGEKFFYPDMMVVCEDETDDDYYTESPSLIVEVLSKSTRRKDETIKRSTYRSLSSLQELVFIEQDFVDIEVCRRSSGWVSLHYFLGDEILFESLDLKVPVSEIYRWVDNEDMRTFLQKES